MTTKPASWAVVPALTKYPDLWRGLKMIVVPEYGIKNLIDETEFTVVSGPTAISVGPEGARLGDGSEEFGIVSASKFNVTDKLSVFWRGSQRKGANNFDRIFEIGGFSAYDGGIGLERDGSSTTNFRFQVYGAVGVQTGTNLSTITLSQNQTYSIVVTSDAVAPLNELYIDNVQTVTDTSVSRDYDDLTEIAIGCYQQGRSLPGPYITEIFYEWEDRILTDAERAILDADPYALIRPDPLKVLPMFAPANDTGTTITAGAASLTLTANAASVSAATHITAGVASLTLTANEATAVLATHITAGSASLNFVARAASVAGFSGGGGSIASRIGMSMAMRLGL